MIYTLVRPFGDPAMNKLAAWVAAMMTAAEGEAKALGRSPEAIVAQAALESSWGRAAIGHNLFGIKADSSWHGPTLTVRTAEEREDGSVYFINAAFRDYASFADCLADHFAFLKANGIYADAGVFTAKTDLDYFAALKRAGYATDVDYVAKLCAMLDSVKVFTSRMVASETAPAIAQAPPTPRLLMVGSKGPDVAALQAALTAAGFSPGGRNPDGDFGPATRAALVAFQRSKQLEPDGIVGLVTRAALGL